MTRYLVKDVTVYKLSLGEGKTASKPGYHEMTPQNMINDIYLCVHLSLIRDDSV